MLHGRPAACASFGSDAAGPCPRSLQRVRAVMDTGARDREAAMGSDTLVIAQFSDFHCGDARFDPRLMRAVVDEIVELLPDLVVVPGDLTEQGYLDQFVDARSWLEQLECPNVVIVPGNHDARNVGFMHFETLFGQRFSSTLLPYGEGGARAARVVAVDSSRPDLNQGEIGRDRYRWLFDQLTEEDDAVRMLVMHHHLVSVPGTGRERNILWDAGDVLQILSECRTDLVLAGHKHVPYVWQVNGIVIATSGTAATRRTRGRTPPSFNIVRVTPEEIRVTMRNTGQSTGRETVFPRRPEIAVGGTARRGATEPGVAMKL
ncbi:MAG: 3',5'-cyclic-nucleotide phosphodiesterase [Coriobacteriaceae bacterium]|nr:3',5'-cyclic-nucleotide phosphodiesterase [Coriobacteriaceae bacterium]